MMKKVNQGAVKFQKFVSNYELSDASLFLADRVFKQKDETKSEVWRDELRRAIARLQLTLNTTDENVATLSLPWYGGRLDEFGRVEDDSNVAAQRWRGRPNFSDPAYWNAYWEQFFVDHGYFTKIYEDMNCEFIDVWPTVETFLLQRAVDARDKENAEAARLLALKREEEAHLEAIAKAKLLADKAAKRQKNKQMFKNQNNQNDSNHNDNEPPPSPSSSSDYSEDSKDLQEKERLNLQEQHLKELKQQKENGQDNEEEEEEDKTVSLKDISLSALVIGNGMSKTPLQLYELGFKSIVVIDISSKIVVNLTERFKNFPGIEVMECDARNLDRFKEASFDLVVDKGLIDALYSGYVGFKDVDLVNEGVCRVLNTGGCFMSVSYAPPPLRAQHFEESSTPDTKHRFHPWNIKTAKGGVGVGDGAGLWIYLMQRLPPGVSKEIETDLQDKDNNQGYELFDENEDLLNEIEIEKQKELDHININDDDDNDNEEVKNDENNGEQKVTDKEGSSNTNITSSSNINHKNNNNNNNNDNNDNGGSSSRRTGMRLKPGAKILCQASYQKQNSDKKGAMIKGGFVKLQSIRDPDVLNVVSRAPRVEHKKPNPTLEEMLKHSMTPEEAVAAQIARKKQIEAGSGLNGNPTIASEVGWEMNAESVRRGKVDNAAIDGSLSKHGGDGGYLSEAYTATVKMEEERKRRMFNLDPIKEVAQVTVQELMNDETQVKTTPPVKREELTDVNSLISELMKGQQELTRLRLERPPQPLEPRGDAFPVTNVEYDKRLREKEDEELRAHRAKMGLDETDLSRPPEKWTPAMLSFVEYVPYGPKPEEEKGWVAMDNPTELFNLCQKVVCDAACSRQLQQWCDGKSKVYKYFLTRALEATEDKAPVNLLRQALNKALGEYRKVDIEFIRLAENNQKRTITRTKVNKKKNHMDSLVDEGTKGGTSSTPTPTTSRPGSSTVQDQIKRNYITNNGNVIKNKNEIQNKNKNNKNNNLKNDSSSSSIPQGNQTIQTESNSMKTLRMLEEKLLKKGNSTKNSSYENGFNIDDDPYGDDDDD